MAKIALPLMSLRASGSIANFLTFSKRDSGQQVRWQKKQSDLISAKRILQRAKFLSASISSRFWQVGDVFCGDSICGTDMDSINFAAKFLPMSGYNLSIKQVVGEF